MQDMEQALAPFVTMPEGIDRRIKCPVCPPRKKKGERTLSIRRDGDSILYNCWHCETSGRFRERPSPSSYVRSESNSPLAYDQMPLSRKAIDFLTDRAISTSTAEKYGVFSSSFYSRRVGKIVEAIGFPYFEGNRVYAVKLRALDTKDFIQAGSCRSFFGEHLLEGDIEDIIIAEGEMDVLAGAEAGITNIVSVPNGAPNKPVVSEDRENGRFSYLWGSRPLIDQVERVIIATDADDPGNLLAEELARRIGKHKCWRLDPAQYKDINNLLLAEGKDGVVTALRKVRPFPVSGLYDAESFKDAVHDLYLHGAAVGKSTGFNSVDQLFTILPGTLTVVTGVPSSGKSEFLDQVAVNLAEGEEWRTAFASFENEPRFHIPKLIQKKTGKHFFATNFNRIVKEDIPPAMDWVNDHFYFLHQADGSMATVSSIIERLTTAVYRYGIRMAIIDPVNYIERPSDVNETQWVSETLTKLRVWAQSYEVAVFLVAHPRTMYRGEGGRMPIPTGYDISGSAHYINKCDFGLTIHRPPDQDPQVEVQNWKTRFAWAGKIGKTTIEYDVETTRYTEATVGYHVTHWQDDSFDEAVSF